jgi:acylphosphatase
MKRAIIIATGKVQKVGYRDFVQDSARELGITGYVENVEDGTVKIVCEGEEPKIEEFIKDITVKKDFIDVSGVSVKYEAPTDEFKLFKIKYGDVPEELGDRLGTAILYLGATNQKLDAGFKMLGDKQDIMLEKQDKMLEKQDRMLEKQDKMLEKQDKMLEKQDRMLEKQDLMLEKQDLMLEKLDNTIKAIDQSKEEIVTEIRSLREDLRSYMENRFAKIEREIEVIKSKIGMV